MDAMATLWLFSYQIDQVYLQKVLHKQSNFYVCGCVTYAVNPAQNGSAVTCEPVFIE
jgi:hypothetical protein